MFAALYSKSNGKVSTMLNRGLTRYLCFTKVSLLQCDDQKGEDQEWTQRSQLKGCSVIHMMVSWIRRQHDGEKWTEGDVCRQPHQRVGEGLILRVDG